MPPNNFYILTQSCSTRQAIELLGYKWNVLVLHALMDGTKRYGEIKFIVEGVTHKMLAQTLRALERDGIVERTIYPVIPPKVEYKLTPLGETLKPLLGMLCTWADDYFPQVLEARAEAQQIGDMVLEGEEVE